MLSSETLPLNMHIILSDPFSYCFSSYVVCVYNHCFRTNQNFSEMSLTSPVSSLYDDFSSYRVSFYLIYLNLCHLTNHVSSAMSITTLGLDPGPLVSVILHFDLKKPLVVFLNPLLVSVA